MEESISFQVYGKPAPKGSVTRMRGAYLPAGTAASRMHFQLWRENIAVAARHEMGERAPWTGAIRVMAEFQLPAPGNIRKAQWGWLPHVKRPDVDKLARALLDPLTGIVWVDDSQVSFLTVNKVYAWEKRPGVTVVVDQLSNDWCIQHAALHRAVSNVITSL